MAACGISPVETSTVFTGSTGTVPTVTTIVPTSPTSAPTTTVSPSTGDLDDPEVRRVEVGGVVLDVAWVDTAATRSRGLMGVEDLGDLDGMLFDLETERVASFTMRNTLIPLDVYFFDADGAGVGALEMVPCNGEPCPDYQAETPARYALEVPAGSLDLGDRPDLDLP